ncbi:hypothetical protein [uncultured Flavonifractor sp.]|uniref:hypothetical protein n=1 Tax=uncultured Flavonifractor sp. TaxID=1193534 RepID=UPI002627B8B0|nr:hypothetical protein [uncultured Flavonifractor sp.]
MKKKKSSSISPRITITRKVDGHNERVITECSRARYETHRQELGTINQDVVQANSPKRHDTYVYYFADGSRSTLVLGADDDSCVNGAWIAELRELDRLEYNNQHTQTRRHCSLDAQDPEGMGGYYECKRHHDTPRIRLQNEQGNPTPICEIKPVGQSKLELMASKIFERVWGDQREIVLQTCKMLDACYKPDADRRADLMKAKDDSIQLLQQQLDDLVVVRARGEIEQDKFLQRTIEIQQQMEALRQSKAQIASEDYNPGRLDMEAIEAALCEAVEMHDGLVSEDFIDLFVSQVTPLSDSRFAWCLDFSPQPTVAFLNLAGQRKYTTCSMDSKLHFGPFADEEGHTIPFPGSLRR